MAKLKAYLDTSVIGGLVDEEPPIHKAATEALFASVSKGAPLELYVSTLVVQEIMIGPEKVVREFESLIGSAKLRVLERSDEAEELADRYVLQGVIPENERNDALHLAIATVEGMDMVISWNFRHIVNVRNIRGVNGVNLIHGYGGLDIRSPEEVRDARE